MVPIDLTISLVEEELDAAYSFAERHNLTLLWLNEELKLRVTLVQPKTKELFYLIGEFNNYKELPPIWYFTDKNWAQRSVKSNFPSRTNTPYGASIFHPNAVLCIPFNRLAYKEFNGPHSDWGTAAQWINAGKKYATAYNIGEMLSIIYRDFKFTEGRL